MVKWIVNSALDKAFINLLTCAVQVIAEVSQKCGVDEAEIHSALLSDDLHNPLVIAYNLVIDNKRIENAKAEEFNDFFAGGKKGLFF